MRLWVFTIALCTSFSTAAQYNNIRQYLSPKYQNAVTTVEMRQAAQAEGEIWKNLRTVVYDQLYMALSPQGKSALEARKNAWETYLETEISYLGQIYRGELQGTMWYPVLDGAIASLYKKRAETLLAEFDQIVRTQAQTELPPDLILGKWKNADEDLTYSFYDNFTAFQGESVSTGLLFYQFEFKDDQLLLSLLKAEDLTLVKQFIIVKQTLSAMTLKDGDKEIEFIRAE